MLKRLKQWILGVDNGFVVDSWETLFLYGLSCAFHIHDKDRPNKEARKHELDGD